MRPAEAIKRNLADGAIEPWQAQVDILLDIRHLMALMLAEQRKQTTALEYLVTQTPRKPGRPRKKAASV